MTNNKELNPHDVGLAVDKGKVRDNNEDSAVAVDADMIGGDSAQSVGVYAVADGMGGHHKGEVASQLAMQNVVNEIVGRITKSNGEVPQYYQQWLTNAFETANKVVFGEDPEIGTTLVMALVVGEQAYIASVGDSRAYIITKHGIYQITEDQRLVQQMLNDGLITEEEAEKHPYRHILSEAIGTTKDVRVATASVEFDDGNYLLLCSDGLSGELDSETIFNIVRNAESPQTGCDALIAAANEAGGNDNISVVLVHLKRTSH